jgi:hypothetical protein
MRITTPAIAFCAALAAALPARGAETTAPSPFHPPATEAEQALAAILHRADTDAAILDNILGARGTRHFHRSVDYTVDLTPALLRAIREAEHRLVAKECGGHYRAGDICGLDYNPVTCAQDSDPPYLYRTDAAQADQATISYRWRNDNDQKTAAIYRLIHEGGHWRIDAITCDGGVRFN